MGIYLPNVDMPKGDKTLTIQICPDGSIWQQYRGTVPNAKAVPVPPHGRLGDLDALEKCGKDCYGCPYDSCMITEIVKDAPTIIEAEEGE